MYTSFDPPCLSTKVFVWEGRGVLKNYSSGKAIVLAQTVGEAWMKLKNLDERAYFQLRLGSTYVTSEADVELCHLDDLTPKPGFPKQPREYTIEEFQGLVCWGSE